jgi:branched-chain amino acid aminotransferase
MPSPDYVQANSGGRLHDASTPSISPLDRGFLYGDAIYEVWRTVGNRVFAFDEHWERLERSAGAIGMALAYGQDRVRTEMGRTVAAYREQTGWDGSCYIRLQLSRGMGSLGLDAGLAEKPVFVIYVRKLAGLDPEQLEEGIRLHLARKVRRNSRYSLDPGSKTGNYMNNLLGLGEARQAGADDVVMLNGEGALTEASTSNIFLAGKGRVVTPSLSSGILGGVTRHLLLYRITRPAGLIVMERSIDALELPEFDECFLTSTTRDVVPVGSIDGRRFKTGPDTVTRRLKRAFEDYLEANPGVELPRDSL